jgi:4a-hydroxytetrahydrobiopterin dehydratase
MDNSHLVKGHCVPCEGGTKPMESSEVAKYLTLLKTPWMVTDEGKKIEKLFKFKDFKEAMGFVNKVADIAQEQGHHPDIEISYNKVEIKLTTHAIGGLSTNDFIMASKVEPLFL